MALECVLGRNIWICWYANRLAKPKTRENFTRPNPAVSISDKLVTEEIKKWLAKEHQKEWIKASVAGTMKNSEKFVNSTLMYGVIVSQSEMIGFKYIRTKKMSRVFERP